MDGMKHIFQRHAGLIILTVLLALMLIVLYLLRNIVLPFLVGLVLAYILLPVTSWVERRFPKPHRWQTAKRISAIVIVYLLILAVLGTAGYYVVTTAIDSVVKIIQNAPDYSSTAFATIQGWFSAFRDWLPPGTEQQLDDILRNLGQDLANAVRDLFLSIGDLIPATVTYAMGFAALPLFLFYILKDHEHLKRRFYSWLPENWARHAKNVAAILNRVLGGYIRAQLTMGLFVGILALIGLLIIRAPLAVGLAAVAAVTELVPILGPWIGGGIAVLVVLAIDPSKVVWVIVLFLAVQLVENSLLVPRIQGHYLHIHPAIAIVLLVTGAAVAGFWGLVLAVPLASTVVGLYGYVTRTAGEEDAEEPVDAG